MDGESMARLNIERMIEDQPAWRYVYIKKAGSWGISFSLLNPNPKPYGIENI